MTNETNQAQWVESDGVSNLPSKDAIGVYELRCVLKGDDSQWLSYFDGNGFCGTAGTKSSAEGGDMRSFRTSQLGFNRACDAWRDYQGLIAKPQSAKDHRHIGSVSAITGAVLPKGAQILTGDTRKIGPCTSDGCGTYSVSTSAIMSSDEPGIAAMKASAPKQPNGPTIIHGVTVDPVAFAAFLNSQRPKPAPNTTPLGIMTVWNEAADHRLGMWNQGATE
jgi:hypothetical protein